MGWGGVRCERGVAVDLNNLWINWVPFLRWIIGTPTSLPLTAQPYSRNYLGRLWMQRLFIFEPAFKRALKTTERVSPLTKCAFVAILIFELPTSFAECSVSISCWLHFVQIWRQRDFSSFFRRPVRGATSCNRWLLFSSSSNDWFVWNDTWSVCLTERQKRGQHTHPQF